MNILIRLEKESDYRNTEYMIREAFWDVYKPGCDEHLILHKIRKLPVFIKELDFVACDNNKVVGNIIYSKARVINEQNKKFEVLCMGPLGVLPCYQRKGVGALLLNQSIKQARELGYNGIVIYGDPQYYHRFGFVNAKKYGIKTSYGDNFEEFMALELYDGALKEISGKFYEDNVFKIEDSELEIFEKKFPYKQNHVTDTQLKF